MKLFDRIAKRAGIYISRPVLNADAWVKWMEKFGVPNPLPADQMHVTVIASRKDLRTRPMQMTHTVFTSGEFYPGHVAFFGPEANVLAYTWACDWTLTDRHYALQSMGATSDWPEYRPHITLSYDAKGFELSDEALVAMPPSFILGGEVFGPFEPNAKEKLAKAADPGDPSEWELVYVEELTEHEAQRFMSAFALSKSSDLSVAELQTIGLIAYGQPVLKDALEALDGKVDFASSPPPVGAIIKTDEECRLVYGWASVSISKGDHVVDSHRHKIATKALRQLCHGLMRGQRQGKFDHKGLKKTDIVEAMVFDKDVWAAMGDYFEKTGELTKEQADVFRDMKFEGLLAGFHCEDDSVWQLAKDADFELSIGAEEGTLMELGTNG
jgi:hypothetical protein